MINLKKCSRFQTTLKWQGDALGRLDGIERKLRSHTRMADNLNDFDCQLLADLIADILRPMKEKAAILSTKTKIEIKQYLISRYIGAALDANQDRSSAIAFCKSHYGVSEEFIDNAIRCEPFVRSIPYGSIVPMPGEVK